MMKIQYIHDLASKNERHPSRMKRENIMVICSSIFVYDKDRTAVTGKRVRCCALTSKIYFIQTDHSTWRWLIDKPSHQIWNCFNLVSGAFRPCNISDFATLPSKRVLKYASMQQLVDGFILVRHSRRYKQDLYRDPCSVMILQAAAFHKQMKLFA